MINHFPRCKYNYQITSKQECEEVVSIYLQFHYVTIMKDHFILYLKSRLFVKFSNIYVFVCNNVINHMYSVCYFSHRYDAAFQKPHQVTFSIQWPPDTLWWAKMLMSFCVASIRLTIFCICSKTWFISHSYARSIIKYCQNVFIQPWCNYASDTSCIELTCINVRYMT